MPIKEAEKSYNHEKIEKKVQKFWKEEETFKKVNELREKGPRYSFLDGPPYCSGKIHLGTAWNKVIKDSYLRYKSMNGFSLRRQAGWDMHGLPIENKVEHLMGIQSKQEIEEEIGIDKFVDKCKEFAIENKIAMEHEFDQLGVWMDWDDPYMTLDPKYMESSWWTLKRAHEQDLLVNDQRVISWCPHCGTALAAAEIELIGVDEKEFILKNQIAKVRDDYDYIIIDCPPSLSMLTINAMTTADTVLVPIQCEYYALEGLSQLMHTIDLVQQRLNPNLEIEGIVFTMYDARTNLSLQVVENVKENLHQNVYKTIIPRNVRLAEAPSHGLPITMYDNRSAGAESYRMLADEVITNIHV